MIATNKAQSTEIQLSTLRTNYWEKCNNIFEAQKTPEEM